MRNQIIHINMSVRVHILTEITTVNMNPHPTASSISVGFVRIPRSPNGGPRRNPSNISMHPMKSTNAVPQNSPKPLTNKFQAVSFIL